MAEQDQDQDGLWTFSLQGVSRIDPPPTETDEGPSWAVTFECNGPNFSTETEVFVDDVDDEAEVVALAMSGLHEGFAALARATAGRRIPSDGGEAEQRD